jgi:hypothetical protein
VHKCHDKEEKMKNISMVRAYISKYFFGQILSKQLFETGIFHYKFPNFGKKNHLKEVDFKFFWGRVSPHLCLLATILRDP